MYGLLGKIGVCLYYTGQRLACVMGGGGTMNGAGGSSWGEMPECRCNKQVEGCAGNSREIGPGRGFA